MPNQQLAEELHEPIIRKFEKKKVYSSFKDNIWGVNLAHLQLISRYKKEFWLLLCVIDIFLNILGFFLKRQKWYYYYKYFSKGFGFHRVWVKTKKNMSR